MAEYLGSMNCAKCGQPPEEILILTCDHNLCLICAGKNLRREQAKAAHAFQTVVCDICGVATVLDPASSTELLRLTSGSRFESPRRSEGYAKERCSEHPDEEVSYFCFDCETPCVCAECVIHGVHKTHEVQNLRRAYPQVKAKVEDLLLYLTSKVDDLAISEQRIEARKKEMIEQATTAKQQMAHSFDELRQRLDKKERELTEQLDRFAQENLRELESYSRAMHSKAISLNDLCDTVRHVLSSSGDSALMNFYAENRQNLYSSPEAEPPSMGQVDRILAMKCYINPNSVADHIEHMKGLHLSISSLRGIEEDVRYAEKSETPSPPQASSNFYRGKTKLKN